MLCEKCGKNEANVQVQAFSMDGQSKTLHLCTECLAQQKEAMSAEGADFAGLMGALFGKIAERMKRETEHAVPDCPACGTSYKDFRADGTVGCEKCYGAFREKIEEMLLKRNGSARYVRDGQTAAESRSMRIRRLRGEMKSAIENENYEQAAFLRDEIHALEKQA